MLLPSLPFFFSVAAMLYGLLAVLHKTASTAGRSTRFAFIQAEMAYQVQEDRKDRLNELSVSAELKQISEIIGTESEKNYVLFRGLRLSMDSRS